MNEVLAFAFEGNIMSFDRFFSPSRKLRSGNRRPNKSTRTPRNSHFDLNVEILEKRDVPSAVPFSGTTTYTQDFQSMTATNLNATAAATISNTTMSEVSAQAGGGNVSGWYLYAAAGTARWGRTAGTDTSGSFLALFDSQSTPNVALGSLEASSGLNYFGVVLQNTSASTIASVTLTYDAVMNRNPSSTVNPYPMSYLESSTAPSSTSGTGAGTFNDLAGTWITGTGFTTPSTGIGAPGTQAVISPLFQIGGASITQTLTVTGWAPGQFLYIRWKDTDDAGSDTSAGVDNVSISVPVVNPGTSLTYVDPNFSASNPAGFDGDLGAAGTQSATFNSNAFSSIGAAISATTSPGTIVVNGEPLSPYAESPSLPAGDTLALTGTPAGTPPVSSVSLTGLTLAATTTIASQLTSAVTLNSPITLNGATSVNVAGTGSITSVGTISGVGSLTTTGTGTVVLQTAESYSGATNVSAGTLIVNGSTSASSALTLSAGATLEGTGTVAGAITATGIVIPGTPSSFGTLTAGSLSFNTGSTLSVPLLAGGTGELISSGTASIANAVLTFSGSYAGAIGTSFTVLHAPTISGAFSNAAAGTSLSNGIQTFQVSYTSTDVTLTLVPTASIIMGWKAPNTAPLAPNPAFAPTTTAVGILVSPSQQLNAGPGGTITGASPSPFSLAGAWGSSGWGGGSTLTNQSTAIAGGDYVTFGFTVPTGETVSLADIKQDIRRASSGATTGDWQYSRSDMTNPGGTNGAFFDISGASGFSFGTGTATTGNVQATVNLASIANLQNIPAGVTVTFQLLVWGGTGGTFYAVDDSATSGLPTVSGDGLDLEGFVTQTVPTPLEYVDTGFTGSGPVDGDLGASGSQAAVIGTNAFTSISGAISAAAGVVPGLIFVNGDGPGGSTYAENPEVPTGETLVLTGTSANVSMTGLTLDNLATVSYAGSLAATLTSPIAINGSAAPYITVASPGSITSIGTISGTGSLTVNGTGTVVLQGDESYSGGTTVTAGVLAINGNTASGFNVNVESGTLAGTGTIGGAINGTGGIVEPGSASAGGTLTAASATFTGGTFIGNLSPTDLLNVSGAVNFGSGSSIASLVLSGAFPGHFGDTINLITAGGGITGTFSAVTNGALLTSTTGQTIRVNYGTNAVTLTLVAQEYVDPTFTASGTTYDGDRALTGTQTATGLINAFSTIDAAIAAEQGPASPNLGTVTINSVGTGTTYTEATTPEFPAGNTIILTGDSTGTFTPNITVANTATSNGIILDDATKVVYQGTLAATLSSAITLNGATTISLPSSAASLISNGTISGGGSLTMTGPGTVILNGTETYTGATNVSAGNLIINGSTSPSSTITLGTKTTLTGTGSIGGAIINPTGTIDPGTSTTAFTMSAGSLSFFSSNVTVTGVLAEEILPTGNDELVLTSTASLTGGTLALTSPATLAPLALGAKITLLHANGGITGVFDRVSINSATAIPAGNSSIFQAPNGQWLEIDYIAATAGGLITDVVLTPSLFKSTSLPVLANGTVGVSSLVPVSDTTVSVSINPADVLPSGVTFSNAVTAGGVFSGTTTATAYGTYPVHLTATEGGVTQTRTFNLIVAISGTSGSATIDLDFASAFFTAANWVNDLNPTLNQVPGAFGTVLTNHDVATVSPAYKIGNIPFVPTQSGWLGMNLNQGTTSSLAPTGTYSLGALSIVGPQMPILFGNSSTSTAATAAGTIIFNGSSVFGVPNVIFSVTGPASNAANNNLTVKANLNNGDAPMTISLGSTNSTILVGTNSSISISANITEQTTGSSILLAGDSTSTNPSLVLSGNNSFSGTFTDAGGLLQLGLPASISIPINPLGTTAGGTIIAGTGAALDLNGVTINNPEPLTLSGTGISGSGAIFSSNGSVTWPGPVTLAGDTTINSPSNGNDLNFADSTDPITGSDYNLTLTGSGQNSTISAPISTGIGGVTKTGSGTWTLAGPSTYTGATTVSQGSLIVNGSIAAGSAVSFGGGGTLGGTGTIAGAVTVTSGTVNPGILNSPGTLTLGSLLIGSNTLAFDLLNNANDELVVNGPVNISAAGFSFNVNNFGTPSGGAITILHTGGLTGTFAGIADGSTIIANDGQTFLVHYTSTDVTVTVGVPVFTSATSTLFKVGTAGSFNVSATGSPTPTITAGTLPAGITFSGGVLSGTPSAGGKFAITFTASNGVGSPVTQSFVLDVTNSGPQPLVYVSSSIGATNPSFGAPIADADPVMAGSQAAIWGVSAFATIGEGLNALASGGTLTLSGGTYNESVVIPSSDTLAITGASAMGETVQVASIDGDSSTTVKLETTTLAVGASDGLTHTIAGTIMGQGNLTKIGTDTLTLTGTVTFTGTTTASLGTLLVNTTLTTSPIAVSTTGTLGGTGTVGTVTAAGIVNPGTTGTPGTLSTGALTLHDATHNGTLHIDIGATSTFDNVVSSGVIDITGASLALSVNSAGIHPGDSFVILSGTSVTGTFNGGSSVTVGTQTFNIVYSASSVSLVLQSPASLVSTILNSGGAGSVGNVKGTLVPGYLNSTLAPNQHSMVESVVYSFSSAVSLSASDFAISGLAGSGTSIVPTLSVTPNATNTVWTVTFSGAGVNPMTNSIGDGEYALVLSGVAGLASSTYDFFRLMGDLNGDGAVNISDFSALVGTFLRTPPDPAYLGAADLDGDGTIGIADVSAIVGNFLHTVPMPLPN
jgi:fibronectin-binding autotransporter adhesin